MVYKYDEVLNASLKYFNDDDLASKVFVDKYALTNGEGDYFELTPDDMHRRLAREFARVEAKYPNPMSEQEIYELFKEFKRIIPQGSPMSGIGNDFQVQSVGNCFVVAQPWDSYGGILKSDQELAHLFKRRAGCGIDISTIRPKGMKTNNACRTTDGIIPFMERFSNTCREVALGGRRGAEMITIDCRHPQVLDFIKIKRDLKKVTGANVSVKVTDEFMKCVEKGEKFLLRWPIESETPSVTKEINASEIWNELVESNHVGSEPGALFFDTIIRRSPADMYTKKDKRFQTISTNPCLTGDVKVAVADGRGMISIKTLAEKGNDVPVYTLLKNGKIGVKMMRNPRKTGFKEVFEITLENGETFKATENHKILLRNNEYKEIKDLKIGDSVHIGFKFEASIKDVFPSANSKSQNYVWLKNCNQKNIKSEHRMIWEFYNGDIPKHNVIHHVDFNAKNNSIENLLCMTKKDHDILHSKEMIGKKNPIYKLKADEEKWEKYKKNNKGYVQNGENNTHFCGKDNNELFQIVVNWIKNLGRLPLIEEYIEYAKLNNLPTAFSNYRKKEFKSLGNFIYKAGKSAGVDLQSGSKFISHFVSNEEMLFQTIDWVTILGRNPSIQEYIRFARTNCLPTKISSEYRKQRFKNLNVFLKEVCDTVNFKIRNDEFLFSNKTNLKTIEKDGIKFVLKECELCKKDFVIDLNKREISFCGQECVSTYLNSSKTIKEKRDIGRDKYQLERQKETQEKQLKIYSDLKFKLGKTPKQKEWENACREESVPFRVGRKLKYSFKNFKEIKEKGNNYNHKIILIKKCGYEDVYNGTVDDTHNFYFGGWESLNEDGKKQELLINNLQCGEIPLGEDSCRLTLVNLSGFVENPFTDKAKFNYEKLGQVVQKGMRLMDDLVDIEIEQIDKILNKVKKDPEPDNIKKIEIDLWENFKETAKLGRRTGFGITALGDALAMLNFSYGSETSINEVEKIYKTIAINAYKSSCWLAKERGTFPMFDRETERKNEFIEQILSSDKELKELYETYGRRNIALLTTAPAGTVSILSQTTSGIEPVFKLKYTRRKKINPSDKNAKIDFIDDLGDQWQHFDVYHHGFKKWMDVSGKTDIEKSPYFNSTASELNWKDRIKIQSVATKWLDHSLSSTINLPEDISVDEVKNIYMEAWRSGCKGITIYRENSRSGVLVDTKKIESTREAKKRPDALPCDIHHVRVDQEDWIVVVGLMENLPYEIFGGHAKFVEIPSGYSNGEIIKHSRKTTYGRYDLKFGFNGESITLKDIVKQFENKTFGSMTRMISLCLRHKISLNFIVEQLQKNDNEDLFSFSKVIARVLKRYIKDGTKANIKTCSQCLKENSIVYQEGCLRCINCGFSKCG